MSNSNQKSKPFLIFPENSASIIRNILKKHGLQESNKELLEKWKKGKRGFGAILADLIIKYPKANLSLAKLVDLTQKELNTSRQKSQKIIEDLNKEILFPATQIIKKSPSGKKIISIGEQLFSIEKKPKKLNKPKK